MAVTRLSRSTLILRPVVLAAVVSLSLGSAACTGPKVTVISSPELDRYQVKSVAVMPFAIVTAPQVVTPEVPDLERPEGVVRSDISLSVPRTTERLQQPTAKVPHEAGLKVARIFAGKLRSRQGLVVVPPAAAREAPARGEAGALVLAPEELGRRAAVDAGTDAALVGLIRVYKERKGSKLGAEAAAVGFEVKLVAADGRVLWVGNYYEEQRPLNEDLVGFLARGFGFLTAEELATYGAEQLAAEFPYGA